jgi:hypothetical protein
VAPPGEPPATYAAGAVLTGLITIFLLVVSGTPELPRAIGYALALGTLSLSTWCGWKAARTAPVEFDLVRRCVLRGTDKPVRFSEIESIEISERWNDNEGIVTYLYAVTLRLSNGRNLRLGQAATTDEAEVVAKNISTLVGKAVINAR